VKESTRVIIALLAALILGAIIAITGNSTALAAADLLAPIGTLWVNAIRMTVIPLVVSLLITGVASTSELRTIGRMGGRTLIVFISIITGIALTIVPVATFVFNALIKHVGDRPPIPAGAAEAASQVSSSGQAQSFAAWLISLVPSNPIASAASGAMIPLIVFTVLLALAIARSPAQARERLVGFFESFRDAMLILVGWVVSAAPIGVFALLLPIAAHGGSSLVGGIGFYIAFYSITSIAATLALYPVARFAGRVPLGRFARAAIPSQLIALSSSSSIASLPALIESAETLEMDPRVSGFVLPLSVATFKAVSPISWTVGSLFIGWFYGIPLHFRELAIVDLAAIFLAFAAPGVPRGAFLMLAPLFLAIGLPIEGLGILIAVDALPDLFVTVVNVTADLVAATIVARGESSTGGKL